MHSIPRRKLLGSGLGALGAAVAGPLARAADPVAASSRPRATGWATPLAQDYTVVFHNADGGRGLDGPGLVRLADGKLMAAVPVNPGGKGWICHIVQSNDGGGSWGQPVAQLPYCSAVPWEHAGRLYLFAFPRWGGDMLLLHSGDGGRTWSKPVTLFEGRFWNCQTGTAIRDNWLYWSPDDFVGKGHQRGPRVVAGDLSANLMDPKSWRISNHVPFPGLPESLLNPGIRGSDPSQRMLEPNVLNVGGRLRVLATVKPPLQATTNLAAVFDVADDGENIELPFTQFHPMPGGQLKFCVIRDDVSQLFWATVNLAADGQHRFEFKDLDEFSRRGRGQPYHERGGGRGGNDRRFLMLMYGLDGLNWFPAGCVARAGRLRQSFMYASPAVDGNDLVMVSRSSVDAHSRHDADYCTFHRVRNFRRLAMNLRQDIDKGSIS
ncbi:MAG: exo-alpha-sialidase [Verrucomicrobia bacterium]|nr:exo-alpha-sialidase [Verrucomicrobiota bacterium]